MATKEERKDKARCKRWRRWWERRRGNDRALFAIQEAIEAQVHERDEAEADHNETDAAMAAAVLGQLVDLRDLLGGCDRAILVSLDSSKAMDRR